MVCATYVTYIDVQAMGMLFAVSVSVQLWPIVSGIGCEHSSFLQITITGYIYGHQVKLCHYHWQCTIYSIN